MEVRSLVYLCLTAVLISVIQGQIFGRMKPFSSACCIDYRPREPIPREQCYSCDDLFALLSLARTLEEKTSRTTCTYYPDEIIMNLVNALVYIATQTIQGRCPVISPPPPIPYVLSNEPPSKCPSTTNPPTNNSPPNPPSTKPPSTTPTTTMPNTTTPVTTCKSCNPSNNGGSILDINALDNLLDVNVGGDSLLEVTVGGGYMSEGDDDDDGNILNVNVGNDPTLEVIFGGNKIIGVDLDTKISVGDGDDNNYYSAPEGNKNDVDKDDGSLLDVSLGGSNIITVL